MSKKFEPGMAYNMKTLHKVMAGLSVVFLITVVWVALDDYLRPWKKIQVEALKIKRQKIAEEVAKTEKSIDSTKLEELAKKLEEAKKIVKSRQDEIAKVDGELQEIKKELKNEAIINGRLNAQVSALTFQYGVAHAKHDPSAAGLFKSLQKNKAAFAESKDRNKTFQATEKRILRKLASLKREVSESEKAVKKIVGKRDLLLKSKSQTDMNPVFFLRNSPFIDFMDPTLKINQIVLKNITDDRYFQHVPKVDRCTTCHTFIDQPGFEEQPNPHKTHPNLALMLGKESPHPIGEIGCTSCHGGEGQRVHDFNSAAHMPMNDAQEQAWVEKYHWHEPHKVPHVMFKKNQTEAGCVKCHTGVQFIPGATVLNEGRRNIEKFGCYACHKIEGWEHKRKPGPSLEKIASKISKEFFKNWVWSPKTFNKHSKMPSFFSQMNNSEEKFAKKNIAEVNAMAEYIWEKSKDYKPFAKYSKGNPEKGKELVGTLGCMGCHGADGFEKESKMVDSYAGPHLTGTGSKIKNADWLVSWIKNPSHFQEDTIMPSFRLSDAEANDITAYLMSLKNEKFENLKFEALDKEVRDEILVTYFSAFDTIKVAKDRLGKMTDRERTLELGHRSIGKYGCFSCHSVEGFENRGPIGPELTKVGSKPLTQFGFGHEHDVQHSRDGWIKAHMINPRRWDNGADKPFKDLLRMPNFYMTEREAETITTALIGQVSDYVPVEGVKQMSPEEAIAAEGMKVAYKFNCVGCHQIDGEGGDILAMYEDDLNEGPPWLVDQGHRANSDWFHYFLGNVYTIRPWLSVRMPSFNFTNEEKNKLVALFQAKSEQKTFEEPEKNLTWAPGEREAAKKLFHQEFECASCHTGGFNNDEASAPDLHYAKRRLRYSWIKKWIKNPQSILPHTSMSNFFEGGESMAPEILGGDVDKQVEALTKYIIEFSRDERAPGDKKRY